jgi:predicted nucleic acid-binding protein
VVLRILTGHQEAPGLQKQLVEASFVLAPALIQTEVANGLWKLKRVGALADLNPQDLLREATELVDHLEPDQNLQVEALALAIHLNHPVYDCLYLSLARREAACLLTVDRRLQALVQQVLP